MSKESCPRCKGRGIFVDIGMMSIKCDLCCCQLNNSENASSLNNEPLILEEKINERVSDATTEHTDGGIEMQDYGREGKKKCDKGKQRKRKGRPKKDNNGTQRSDD